MKLISKEISEKFDLIEVGIITTPDNYDHNQYLKFFFKYCDASYGMVFNYEDITDKNFANPGRILKSGDKLLLSIIHQKKNFKSSVNERMELLNSLNSIYPGVQGVCLSLEQKYHQIPRSWRIDYYDKQENLWKNPNGEYMSPYLTNKGDGGYNWGIHKIDFGNKKLSSPSEFFCFREA